MSGSQGRVRIIPVTLPVANRYIALWHRHHAALETVHGGTVRVNRGFAWVCVAGVVGSRVAGVAVLGRPTNRNSDDGQTIEVLRLASDGTDNVPSALLGASARVAKELGAWRVITYTLESESGISLRAAGWTKERSGIATCWTKGRGKARRGGSGATVERDHMGIGKVRWGRMIRPILDLDDAYRDADTNMAQLTLVTA